MLFFQNNLQEDVINMLIYCFIIIKYKSYF